MITPVNNLIVSIDKKFYDSVTFESGQTLFFDPTWHPEEYAMLRARVDSLPRGVIDRHDYKGVTIPMHVGDDILMRYDVVFAYKDQPDRDTPIYKNLLFQWNENTARYEEKWKCDILQIFAIIREHGWEMINGYVLLDPITEVVPDYSDLIVRPDNYKEVPVKDRAYIKAIGENALGLKPRDQVYFTSGTVMCYSINTEEYHLIKDRNILAKVN